MTAAPDLFAGFETLRVNVSGGTVFVRAAGQGPPLLLLHGYPQTHACWHKIAGELAKHFRVYAADLPGYGDSFCPTAGADASAYSKRAMAAAVRDVMAELGHDRFHVCGHDRGARVAYRLALDHPALISAVALLDILPTEEVWRRLTAESALTAYHWTFLAQPRGFPERMIAADPRAFLRHTIASWAADKSLARFSPEAIAHYAAAFAKPERIAATCEDYRAGATIDRIHDQETLASGQRITCPALVLWGSNYMGKGAGTPLDIWRTWCVNVHGQEITSGHFLPEEAPEETLAALLPFLLTHR